MKFILLAATLGCGAACAVPGVDGEPVPAARPADQSAASDRAVTLDVIAASNRARRSHGASELLMVEAMNAAAQAHAEHLRDRRELDHISWTPGRRDPAARLSAAGVKWTRVGENLAQLSPRSGAGAAVIEMWLDSPGHRHNLLNPPYTLTGAGVARDERGYLYVVQMYADD